MQPDLQANSHERYRTKYELEFITSNTRFLPSNLYLTVPICHRPDDANGHRRLHLECDGFHDGSHVLRGELHLSEKTVSSHKYCILCITH